MKALARLGLLSFALLAPLAAPPEVAAEEPLREVYPGDDFTLREARIPMRDGVKLYTLILTPKRPQGPLPLLLLRTPYDASGALSSRPTTRLSVLARRDDPVGDDFIFVYQDIRGRYESEGSYEMYRPPRGEFNRTATDETTDAWDTIDWLVKNVAGHNGNVGIWGTSYPGWLALAALRDPHPALAAAVPAHPVGDVWKADDWFHWGAFRALYAFEFVYNMETRPDDGVSYPFERFDLYSWALARPNLAKVLGTLLDGRHEMWRRFVEFPAYGPYWKAVAADRWFDEAPSRLVPTLHVHGWFDQEDIYGAPAAYAAMERHDAANDRNFFVAGPWRHGGHRDDGSRLGAVTFDEDSAKRYRREILLPFLRKYLHRDAVPAPSPATVFETGSNRWQRFSAWPPAGSASRRIYLQPGGGLDWSPPTASSGTAPGSSATAYVADPRSPVPYTPRPIWGTSYDFPAAIDQWKRWLVEDQRFVDGRPDVLTFESAPLAEEVTIRGAITAKLFAETTGSDADWVVKLIDVFPDEDGDDWTRSGYQLMVSGDIFRGRYRESHERATPIRPGAILEYTIPLPQVSHTFGRGHRLMIQIQSSWFPLYDLNPQTFVPSIFDAEPSDFRAATHRIHHSAAHPTRLEVEIAPAGATELVAASPAAGFHFPYLLRVPARLEAGAERALLVEPNNTGTASDDFEVHLAAARKLAQSAIGASVSRALDLPLLVPVFPRPGTEWQFYTHQLDRDTMALRDGPMRRLDLQLVAMIDDARRRLAAKGIRSPEQVLLTGFSASGTFVNRFTTIHPERVHAVAGGGLNGILIAPRAALGGVALPWPLGLANFAELTGAPFDEAAWKRVPQRYYMGALDDNDAVQFDDGYAPDEKAIVDRAIGAKMQPDRWERCQALYRDAGANVTFRTYENVGHFTDDRINAEIADFFRAALAARKP
jgi:putative CocE/NonD family hydrolase